MQIELRRIQREVGITTIFVTHDQEEALTLSDRIGILRAGRLIRHGPPQEVYDAPGDAFTARFLGEANLFDVEVTEAGPRLRDGTPSAWTPPRRATFCRSGPSIWASLSGTAGRCPDPGRAEAAHLRRGHGHLRAGLAGQVLKAVGRHHDFAALPESGPVWVRWAAEDARWVRP